MGRLLPVRRGYSQRHQTETVPQLVGGHVEGQPDVPVRGEAGGQAPLERVGGPLPRGVIVQRRLDNSLIGGADGATQLGYQRLVWGGEVRT